jgi:hypothetical protein
MLEQLAKQVALLGFQIVTALQMLQVVPLTHSKQYCRQWLQTLGAPLQ